MTTYPHATLHPLYGHSDHGTLSDKTLIVLHITAGPTAKSAMNTFEASKAPHRVSAHFVIDRNGTVYELLPLEEIAWHASEVNHKSIGIEHAAIPGNPQCQVTEEQYNASSKLVAWLCEVLKIPCDRAHILGHNEASPKDGHVGCCAPTLDPDRVVAMAQAP